MAEILALYMDNYVLHSNYKYTSLLQVAVRRDRSCFCTFLRLSFPLLGRLRAFLATLHSSVQRPNRCFCGGCWVTIIGYRYRDCLLFSFLNSFLRLGKSSLSIASRGPYLHLAVRPSDNEARATLLRASSHTCFARPAIFGDDFLRIELEETGEVVPFLSSPLFLLSSRSLSILLSSSFLLSFSLSLSLFLFISFGLFVSLLASNCSFSFCYALV